MRVPRAPTFTLLLVTAFLAAMPAQAASRLPAPELGRYGCIVSGLGPPGPSGIVTVQIFPSALGNLDLRSRGRYRTTRGSSGRFSFDRRRARVRFTGGSLGRLKVTYAVRDGYFDLAFNYKGQSHECSRKSKRARAPRTSKPNGRWTGRILVTNSTSISTNLGDTLAIDVRRGTTRPG